uniref:WAPL cohesin release factor b n=1 Tax=Paramormyrops kingsleyae TaxID=1676925 RepID=A0A3B3R5T1_9TELE
MTSRFGKTYSRKGGDGNSKFDEVLSNKRATLSTKWGETTFKAQLGSKRPNLKPDLTDTPKKARPSEEEDTEDPFGFDSDDESKPVTSRTHYSCIQGCTGHLACWDSRRSADGYVAQ